MNSLKYTPSLFIVLSICLLILSEYPMTTFAVESNFSCWVGNTDKDSLNYPPVITSCSLGTCQTVEKTHNKVLQCATESGCLQLKQVLETGGKTTAECCQTINCNSLDTKSDSSRLNPITLSLIGFAFMLAL